VCGRSALLYVYMSGFLLFLFVDSRARGRGTHGARLAPATHGSERRVHFDGGGELPGVAMH
jgi:hypothetical protein